MIGHHCDRWVWLSFRWAVLPLFSGRMLRLFRRGQNEEQTVISDLRRIGASVSNTQTRVAFGAHIGGSIDGVVVGAPGCGAKKHVLEIKTHNKASFADLEKNGVEKSKPQHYAQMQLYMRGMKLDRALYFAACKDDDSIHTERVKLDNGAADAILARGVRIVSAQRIPVGVSDNPSWYQCKMCDAHAFCHEGAPTREVNCRTCAHSTAVESGWHCARHDADGIPESFQHRGCEDHVIHPDLVPWERVETESAIEATYVVNGRELRNGHPDAFVFASDELLANPQACIDALDGGIVAGLRREFDARIV